MNARPVVTLRPVGGSLRPCWLRASQSRSRIAAYTTVRFEFSELGGLRMYSGNSTNPALGSPYDEVFRQRVSCPQDGSQYTVERARHASPDGKRTTIDDQGKLLATCDIIAVDGPG